jgi:hypothetical protein
MILDIRRFRLLVDAGAFACNQGSSLTRGQIKNTADWMTEPHTGNFDFHILRRWPHLIDTAISFLIDSV